MRSPAELSDPLSFQAWCTADELKQAITEFNCCHRSLEVGREMQAAGERIRSGSLERAEAELARAKARMKDAIGATRRILDSLERSL